MDFISVKEFLRGVAAELDHRVIVPAKDPSVKIDRHYVRFVHGGKERVFPKEDCALIEVPVASAEALAEYVLDRVLKKVKFPKNVDHIEIGVDEGRGQGAWVGRDL